MVMRLAWPGDDLVVGWDGMPCRHHHHQCSWLPMRITSNANIRGGRNPTMEEYWLGFERTHKQRGREREKNVIGCFDRRHVRLLCDGGLEREEEEEEGGGSGVGITTDDGSSSDGMDGNAWRAMDRVGGEKSENYAHRLFGLLSTPLLLLSLSLSLFQSF